METSIGLFCLAGIWLFGAACGYAYCLVRQHGRPHIIFHDELIESEEAEDATTGK